MTAGAQARFLELWGEVVDIGAAMAVLQWDQETQMPSKGQRSRGKQLATLAGLRHAKLTHPNLGEALNAAAEDAEDEGDSMAQVREARRLVDRASKVPPKLAKALAEAESRGLASWQQSRAESDFSLFRDSLTELVSLQKERASCLAGKGSPYDALLDVHEPGTTESQLVPIFEQLKKGLGVLLDSVHNSGVAPCEDAVRGHFPKEKQLAFSREVITAMGYDIDAGRIDLATHPFCTGFSNRDVRITWRFQENDLRPALFGLMHEAGHALYEQGLSDADQRTPLGTAVGLGMHESQSRLWENLVGRSREFWEWALPIFHRNFPDKKDVGVDEIWPALHLAQPGFIRVEADEATYDLHVLLRFEVERQLFAGGVEVDELSDLWDATSEELLGVRPPNPAMGVLQDIHWAMGAYGYFPTYTLGNLVASQLWDAASQELDISSQVAAGEFCYLREWLRAKVHCHGSRFSTAELVENATGAPLSPAPFLARVTNMTEMAYGVEEKG